MKIEGGMSPQAINIQSMNQSRVNNAEKAAVSQGDVGISIKQQSMQRAVENTPVEKKKDYEMTVSDKAIISAIESANKKLVGSDKEFEFSIHDKTKAIMVKVINKETKEVVREIPPEKILDMISKLMELSGVFVDEKR